MLGLIWLWIITLGGLVFLIMLAIEWMKGMEETQEMRKQWKPKQINFDNGLSWLEVTAMLMRMEHAQRKHRR